MPYGLCYIQQLNDIKLTVYITTHFASVLVYYYNFWWAVCVCVCIQTLPTCIWYRAESRKRSSWWTCREERGDGLPHAAADMNWERMHRDGGTEGGKTEGGRTAFPTRHEGGCSLPITPAHTHTQTDTHTGHSKATSWCETAGAVIRSCHVGQSWQNHAVVQSNDWQTKRKSSFLTLFACDGLFQSLELGPGSHVKWCSWILLNQTKHCISSFTYTNQKDLTSYTDLGAV